MSTIGCELRRADGAAVTFGGLDLRTLAMWLLWVTVVGGLVDALVASADSRRRSLHDLIAGTVVVRRR